MSNMIFKTPEKILNLLFSLCGCDSENPTSYGLVVTQMHTIARPRWLDNFRLLLPHPLL
jgi:hypothetical protein